MSRPDGIPEEIWTAVANELAFPGVHVHANSYSIVVERMSRAIMAERKRCLDIANGWLIAFGETGAQLKFTTPQQYANDAVEDIAGLINSGANPMSAQSVTEEEEKPN